MKFPKLEIAMIDRRGGEKNISKLDLISVDKIQSIIITLVIMRASILK